MLLLAGESSTIVQEQQFFFSGASMPTAIAHDPKAVANYLLDCAQEDGESLTPMKLIKLVYLCHGWHLGLTDQPLIRENVEAWRYGPVIPSIYHDFKGFGSSAINRYGTWPERDGTEVKWVAPKLNTANEVTTSIIRQVWRTYKQYGAQQLSAMTHQPGTPWYVTWHEGGAFERLGTDIPDDLIRDHFKKKADSD